MSDIFQEVDEEVRSDRFKAYWQAYGAYIIATAVLIILITSGRVIWKDYTESRAEAESESFANAFQLEESGKSSEAIAAYNDLAATASTGVATLAQLRAAGALLAAGREDEAIAAYEHLAGDDRADREIRELASLNAASLMMGRNPSDDVRARLEKLAVDDGAWKSSAKELLGVMAYREGDTETARALFTDLLAANDAPRSLRTRVAAFLSMMDAAEGVADNKDTTNDAPQGEGQS